MRTAGPGAAGFGSGFGYLEDNNSYRPGTVGRGTDPEVVPEVDPEEVPEEVLGAIHCEDFPEYC